MDLFCAVLRDPWEIIYKVSGMIMGLLRRTAGAVLLAMTVPSVLFVPADHRTLYGALSLRAKRSNPYE